MPIAGTVLRNHILSEENKMADVNLTWNPNPAEEQIEKYRVFQDGELVGEPTEPQFTIPNAPEGEHEYQVSAVGLWGESDRSEPLRTPPAASVPGGISIQINVSVTV